MRTKTLFLAAAFVAAGLASSMAQSNVYSLNIVGYVNYTQAANSFNLAANPLNQANNDVANVFTAGPSYPNLTIYKRNIAGTGYDSSTFDPDLSSWTDLLDVSPGAGVWVATPAGIGFTNTFVGEVVLNSTNAIPAGYSLKGSIFPQAGLIQADLNYVPGANDTISQWNGLGYNDSTFDPDLSDWTPGQPSIGLAQGFWIYNAGSAKTWVRNFTP